VRFAQLGGDRPCARIWLHRQLALQQRSEVVIVLERVGSASAGSQRPHDQAMRVLAQAADGYSPVGGTECGLVVASPKLLLAELHHGIERQAFQTLAFGSEPFGPGLLRDLNVGQ
jgi:hypothetical protein